VLRLYLYARVRISLHLLHMRPRVQQAPGIPCALFSLGETRRGKAGVCSLPVCQRGIRQALAPGITGANPPR
jgi:hypothetical protein